MGILDRLRGTDDELRSLGTEWNDLRAAANDRLQRMDTYRTENQRARDPDIELKTADLADYGRQPVNVAPSRHNIPIPLGMAMTVKHAYRISGRLPDAIVDRRDDSPQERYRSDAMEKVVWAIIRASGGETQVADGSWDSSQLGAAVFDLYFDFKQQIPIMRACDPTGIVEVQGVNDPHDFQRVYKSWTVPLATLRAEYRDQLVNGQPVEVQAIQPEGKWGTTDMVTVVQMTDKTRRIRFVPGSNIRLYEQEHNYGFVPYVIIPNLGPYRDVWGWADYELVRPLLHYLVANLSREADIIRAVANGTYIEKGTGQNPEHIKRTLATGGTIPSKRDGSLEPVDVPDIPVFAKEHGERVMELIKMTGFSPDAAWGKPGAASGSDRGLQLQPLLELTAMKQANWAQGLGRLFGYGFQMIEKKMVGSGTTYRGAKQSVGARRMPFTLPLGPDLPPEQQANPAYNADAPESIAIPEFIDLPRSPRELFDGDYSVRFMWQNRIDPDDPAFVLSELNKFQSGAQSMRTTLERLGFQAPEDEMRQIEQEAERFPWVNQGMVSLLMAQFRGNAQGTGGGAPEDALGRLGNAMGMMGGGGGGAGGALDADAGAEALGAPGEMFGGA